MDMLINLVRINVYTGADILKIQKHGARMGRPEPATECVHNY